MPQKKDARKRTKKPGKIADLPAKSLKGKDAAKVKGGWSWGAQTAIKLEPIATNQLNTDLLNQQQTTLKISQ